MRVETITVYPVKGCRRVEVNETMVQPWGLAADRRWVVVDARTDMAITLRDTTRLTQILPTPDGDGLLLRSRRSLTSRSRHRWTVPSGR